MGLFFKKLVLSLACCVAAICADAQAVARATDTGSKVKAPPAYLVKPKGPKAIASELSVGLRLNSNGWSVFTDLGKVKPKDMKHSDMFYNVRFWQLEFTEKRHAKEYKSNGIGGGKGSNTYKYGKINNLYALKLGRGYTRMLAGKPDPGSVSIHWLNAGGVVLGMLKPYYLNIDGDPNAIKYDDATKEHFLDQQYIEGSAGFGKGVGEIKFIPGFHLKSAIHFDFSANRKSVLGVEAGVNGEYYTQEIKLMANQPASSLFLDLYVAIQFGKRW